MQKHYTPDEIKKRSMRLVTAREKRAKQTLRKDDVILWMLKQVYPEGLRMHELQKWSPFPYTFLVNSVRRLEKDGSIKFRKEFDPYMQRLVNRFFYAQPTKEQSKS